MDTREVAHCARCHRPVLRFNWTFGDSAQQSVPVATYETGNVHAVSLPLDGAIDDPAMMSVFDEPSPVATCDQCATSAAGMR